MAIRPLNQQERVLAALLYAATMVGGYWLAEGEPFPPFGAAGVWFYSGVLILLLSVAVQEPYFTTPANCLVNASALLIVVVSFPSNDLIGTALAPEVIDVGRWALGSFALVLIALGMTAVFTRSGVRHAAQETSRFATAACGAAGSARTVFSLLYLGGVYAVHAGDPETTITLVAVWVLVVVVRPVERGIPSGYFSRRHQDSVGMITGLRSPGLAEARLTVRNLVPGTTVKAAGTDLLTLDVSAAADGVWALLTTSERLPAIGAVLTIDDEQNPEGSRILGPVEPGTDLEHIRVRVPSETKQVEEGHLLRVPIRGDTVLYQVISAVARAEAIETEVGHRFVEITARKIGAWDPDALKFDTVAWLPVPGASVELVAAEKRLFQADCIGHIPDSSYGIRIDEDRLVTHNTAVLGILGMGKTYLVFELVRRVLAVGTKVVVIDITGQYAAHFSDIIDETADAAVYDTVEAAIAPTRGYVSRNVHEGGNHAAFRQAIRDDLAQFLASGDPVKVYDPDRFEVTRQDSKPFNEEASMAPLTMVEVTRMIAETLLELLQAQGPADDARVCLVLEEAHSLVPEWNSVAYDGDQRAANGTAKAVLQGRKYGLGVMLVTQRTANVTKTVLNQCHTVFALRSFDATGMEFLRNYVGDDYVGVLSSLKERTAVFFGRASSSPTPVIIRLNDHEDMMKGFWSATDLAQSVDEAGRLACSVSGCLGFVDLSPPSDEDCASGRCVSCATWFFQCADCDELIEEPDVGGFTRCPGCDTMWSVEPGEEDPSVSRLEAPF